MPQLRIAASAAALLCLLTACSGSSGKAVNAASSASQTHATLASETPGEVQPAPGTVAPSAQCGLLSAADVSAVVGFPVQPPVGVGNDALSCSYVGDVSPGGDVTAAGGSVMVEITKGGADEAMAIHRGAFDMLGNAVTPVAELGTDAISTVVGEPPLVQRLVSARKGDTAVLVTLVLGTEAGLEKAPAIASKALTAFAQ